jgi:CRP-like cAMP-binding protein
MISSECGLLRQFEWLESLGDDEIDELERIACPRRHARRELVFTPSASPSSVYLLHSGLVRIYRLSEGGAETSYGYVGPGELFGELPALGAFARESFAETVRPSLVWKVPREAFQRLLTQRPQILMQLARQIGHRLKRAENRIEDLVFRNVRTRVARMLLELGEDFGHGLGGGQLIDIPLTQGELATLVGATRQTVNQTLRELEAEGLVGRENRRIALFKPEGLLRIVQSAPGL